ncbi:MAG: hypothetical protein WCG15_01990 [Actinomycetes bacterium]|jgi:hypothetical protein
MATNHYFNNFNAKNEQNLIEDLVVESIKIMGFEGYYIPNDNTIARDLLFGEDPVKKFNTAFQVEFYLSSSSGYSGAGDFFSKFGIEIKNNVKVILSRRSFNERIPVRPDFTRPREGDLVWIPFLNGTGELYEITFTEQAKDFFQLGRQAPYFYELSLEEFKYSQEVIDTGVPDIDVVVTENAYTLTLNMSQGSGNYNSKEIVYQSRDGTYANSSSEATVSSWNRMSKVLKVTNIRGAFANTANANTLIGLTSNAHYQLANTNPLNVELHNDHYDNLYIQTQGDSITDFSETNPFGTL